MTSGRQQCKDIPDSLILEWLGKQTQEASWYVSEDNSWLCIRDAFPQGTPENLMLAKLKSLIKRGLIDGCACGCRGEFKAIEPVCDCKCHSTTGMLHSRPCCGPGTGKRPPEPQQDFVFHGTPFGRDVIAVREGIAVLPSGIVWGQWRSVDTRKNPLADENPLVCGDSIAEDYAQQEQNKPEHE